MTITNYCHKLKFLADALVDVDQPVSDKTLVMITLCGLNENFGNVATILAMKDPFPTFNKARLYLLRHIATIEPRLRQLQHSSARQMALLPTLTPPTVPAKISTTSLTTVDAAAVVVATAVATSTTVTTDAPATATIAPQTPMAATTTTLPVDSLGSPIRGQARSHQFVDRPDGPVSGVSPLWHPASSTPVYYNRLSRLRTIIQACTYRWTVPVPLGTIAVVYVIYLLGVPCLGPR